MSELCTQLDTVDSAAHFVLESIGTLIDGIEDMQ